MGPAHWGLKKYMGCLCLQAKLIRYWLTIWSESAQENIIGLVGCHDTVILRKSPIEWRQRPDMTTAVDWDVKHQFKQI